MSHACMGEEEAFVWAAKSDFGGKNALISYKVRKVAITKKQKKAYGRTACMIEEKLAKRLVS